MTMLLPNLARQKAFLASFLIVAFTQLYSTAYGVDDRKPFIIVVTDSRDVTSGKCPHDRQDLGGFQRAVEHLILGLSASSKDAQTELVLLHKDCNLDTDTQLVENLMQILGRSIPEGVITAGGPTTNREVLDIMKHFPSVSLIEMLPAGTGVSKRRKTTWTHFIVPHFTYSLAMDAVEATRYLRWPAVRMISPNLSTLPTTSDNLYPSLANDQGICILRNDIQDKDSTETTHLYPMVLPYTPGMMANFTKNLTLTDNAAPLLLMYPDDVTLSDLGLYEIQRVFYTRLLVGSVWTETVRVLNESCRSLASVPGSSQDCPVWKYLPLIRATGDRLTFGAFLGGLSFILEHSGLHQDPPCVPSSLECLVQEFKNRTVDPDTNLLQMARDDAQLVQLTHSGLQGRRAKQTVYKQTHSLHFPKNLPVDAATLDCGQRCHVICRRCFPLDPLVKSPCEEITGEILDDDVYFTGRAEFITKTWAVAVLAISVLGASAAWVCLAYVGYKVCRKAIGKGNVGLGVFLLASVSSLFLSVIPYVVSPSESVCGLRYLLPGVSYALCFSGVLAKLMSIQSYKQVGLGGDVSQANLCVTLLLAVGVQVAASTIYWLHRDPALVTRVERFSGELHYACDFQTRSFVLYHVYVLLLLLACLAYAWLNRHERKNSGEAGVFLVACLACLAVWLVWVILVFVLDRDWSDVIVCAGILGCAMSLLVIVFTPKIRMVSRLSYNISSPKSAASSYANGTSKTALKFGRQNRGFFADSELDYVPEMFQNPARVSTISSSSLQSGRKSKEPRRHSQYAEELTNY